MSKIGKACSVENADIAKVFYMPHHVDHCCTDVIRGYCCFLGHSCTNVMPGHCVSTTYCNNGISGPTVAQQWEPLDPIVAKTATDGWVNMNGRTHKVFCTNARACI
jgi:hypothetical protein